MTASDPVSLLLVGVVPRLTYACVLVVLAVAVAHWLSFLGGSGGDTSGTDDH